MIVASAGSRLRASLRVANLSANPIESVACLVIGAVLVVLALAADARYQGVALVAGLTNTIGTVVLSEALSALTALQRAVATRVQALLIVAGLVIRAVRV